MLQAELPTFEASWWPIALETVAGSGEHITIAALVRSASGQSQVRQLVSPTALAAMFGSAGAGMRFLVEQTTLAIQRQLDKGIPVSDLQMPFGGVSLGSPRDCVAQDMNEVFAIAFRLGGAFGTSNFGGQPRPSDETRQAFEEWADKIRIELLSNPSNEGLEASFNVPLVLTASKRGRFGFLRGGYAANFGVLRPGRSVSTDERALKVKIFDLEALRRSSPLLARRTELLVGYPALAAGSPYSHRELLSQRDAWQFIEHEAKERQVTAVRYGLASEAAAHLQGHLTEA